MAAHTAPGHTVAVILPVLNEAARMGDTLHALAGAGIEQIIVVDGGSHDATCTRAVETRPALAADGTLLTLLNTPFGRAGQMNAGAACARADSLLFLHADTRLPNGAVTVIREAMIAGADWGRFDVCFDDLHWPFRMIAWFMNRRSRLTGIATGDQAIFVRRVLFERAGGYDDIPLMEDIALCVKLKAYGPPACLREQVTTSARRWQKDGWLRTVLLMWSLRAGYALGVAPARLARHYRDTR